MVWLIVAGIIALIDLGIKRKIERTKELNNEHAILKGKIIVTKFYNDGAILGFMKNCGKLLLGITLVLIGILISTLLFLDKSRGNVILKCGLALILGGALSNGFDRLFKGKVTDYFRINVDIARLKRIIFNLGDIAIFIGGLIVLIANLLDKRK